MWTDAVRAEYDPVKKLGEGAFGVVWMARPKSMKNQEHLKSPQVSKEKDHSTSHRDVGCVSDFVAIKAVDTSNPVGLAYAYREILILQELDHPHIMKVLRVFDGAVESGGSSSLTYVALSLAHGPTLEQVLTTGGAAGIPLARLVSAQLVSAIAYMHSHAVLHRDLKPDNIVIDGADLKDEALWNDENIGESAVISARWNTVVVDFGFARALSPDNALDDIGLSKTLHNTDEQDMAHALELMSYDGDHQKYLNNRMDGSTRRGRNLSDTNHSISHVRVRDLSALGHRQYAAPEIINGARNKKPNKTRVLDRSGSMHGSRHGRGRKLSAEALTECVSSYGMDADSYSLGTILRYMLTGVPPGNDVSEYITLRTNCLVKLIRRVIRKKSEANREKKYRKSEECPSEAVLLIRGLTHWDPKKRTTVRAAQSYPWIKNNDDLKINVPTQKGPVVFLDIEVKC